MSGSKSQFALRASWSHALAKEQGLNQLSLWLGGGAQQASGPVLEIKAHYAQKVVGVATRLGGGVNGGRGQVDEIVLILEGVVPVSELQGEIGFLAVEWNFH